MMTIISDVQTEGRGKSWTYVFWVITIVLWFCSSDSLCPLIGGHGGSSSKEVYGLLFFFLYIPILTYEIIIARAGSPVAIFRQLDVSRALPEVWLFGF